MFYKTIYADPPWMERGGGKCKRGADRHYPLMKTHDIKRLRVKDIADPDGCHLYLWVTNGFLPDGIDVMRAWGFRYVTCITWAKDRIGLGQYFRGKTEQCLFGVMGHIPYAADPGPTFGKGKRLQGVTLIEEPRTKHSCKPESMRSMIELVSPGPRIELFAREKHEGWDVWGDEVEGIDVKL